MSVSAMPKAPCEFRPNGRDLCGRPVEWVVTDPGTERDYLVCAGHVGQFTGSPPWPAVEFECIDMRVVDVEDDGTRVVRVYIKWGDEVRTSDVRFDRVTWEAAGGD